MNGFTRYLTKERRVRRDHGILRILRHWLRRRGLVPYFQTVGAFWAAATYPDVTSSSAKMSLTGAGGIAQLLPQASVPVGPFVHLRAHPLCRLDLRSTQAAANCRTSGTLFSADCKRRLHEAENPLETIKPTEELLQDLALHAEEWQLLQNFRTALHTERMDQCSQLKELWCDMRLFEGICKQCRKCLYDKDR